MDTLYALDTKGRIKQWRVWTEGNIIVVEHGLMEGKKQLTKIEAKPKNIGKANATTGEQQAILEARAKHTKQKDRGYVLKDRLEAIQGTPLLPMLAKDYRNSFRAITFPCYAQPKLDGVRALVVRGEGGEIEYRSRGNKRYPNIESIDRELNTIFSLLAQEGVDRVILDGELYAYSLPLQDIVSAVKKHNENTKHISFHIFDVAIPDMPWKERHTLVGKIEEIIKAHALEYVKTVGGPLIENEAEIESCHKRYLEQGWEGIILRNSEGLYTFGQRSKHLQKYKTFLDAEFVIVGVEQDREGHGVAVCLTQEGKEFKAKLAGTDKERLDMWVERAEMIGKWATIKYQALTKDNIPQFPVLVALRDVGAGGPMY